MYLKVGLVTILNLLLLKIHFSSSVLQNFLAPKLGSQTLQKASNESVGLIFCKRLKALTLLEDIWDFNPFYSSLCPSFELEEIQFLILTPFVEKRALVGCVALF